MTHVFASNPSGTNPFECPEKVKAMLVKALQKTEWASTTDLYLATHKRVKRVLLHGVLMQMLEARELRMRSMPVHGARDRTEFRLMAPNVKVQARTEAHESGPE